MRIAPVDFAHRHSHRTAEMYCLDKLQECMFILGALFEIFRIHLLLHLEVRQSKTTPLESGKARLHLLSPAKQDYTSESGKARPNQCSLGLYTYIIVCILRIRVSESRPYRTMTYLSADLARQTTVFTSRRHHAATPLYCACALTFSTITC